MNICFNVYKQIIVKRIIHIREKYLKPFSSDSFKNVITKMCLNMLYLIYINMYKLDLA